MTETRTTRCANPTQYRSAEPENAKFFERAIVNASVVIISSPDDVHALAVTHRLRQNDVHPLILDSATFPSTSELVYSPIQRDYWPTFSIRTADGYVTDENLLGVWWRRPAAHLIEPAVTDKRLRQFCSKESKMLFQGLMNSLGLAVINPPSSDLAAHQKPLQLSVAARVGYSVPRTIMTNSPDAVRAFFEECDGRVIFKVFTGTSWQLTETRQLVAEDFALLVNLRFAPVIFQEAIDPAVDLRVTVIDDHVFSVIIRPTQNSAKLDWRLDPSAKIEPYALPQRERDKAIALIKCLGLRYGAMDFRITPQGEFVFLEINPGGQFLFIDIHGRQHAVEAMASALCQGRRLQSSVAPRETELACVRAANSKRKTEVTWPDLL